MVNLALMFARDVKPYLWSICVRSEALAFLGLKDGCQADDRSV